MKEPQHIVVVGGGAIGLFSAYFLSGKGHRVTVLDAGNFTANCSYDNAGMIVPSHLVPLAAPGMISQGIRWMLKPRSPFYVKPRLDRELIRWGRLFHRSSTQAHVDASIPVLKELSMASKILYREFAAEFPSISYREDGLLMLFQTSNAERHEREAGEIAQANGLQVDLLSESEVRKREPGAQAIGGVHYRSDAHLDPNKLMLHLLEELRNRGVELLEKHLVTGFEYSQNALGGVTTNQGTIVCDQVVLASGAWTSQLTQKLGYPMPLLPGKGYSFDTLIGGKGPTIPSILCEGKVAVTPFAERFRFGGTLEITHTGDRKVHKKRLQGITETVRTFYPDFQFSTPDSGDVWSGFRPCSPDGLPYIGRVGNFENVIVATGHGMMGISLAPITGKLVQELCSGEQTSCDISRLSPMRFL